MSEFKRASPDSYEKKTLPSGEKNPKYVDLLDEDPPIAGQKFAIMSFVSPEKILKQRELYLFESFVKKWDFTKEMDKFIEKLANAKDKLDTISGFLNDNF